MPRAGLDSAKVTAAAAAILDREGPDALSLARVAAELGVKSPSLYNHVDGLDGLVRSITLMGNHELAEVCRTAAMGRSGPEALRVLAEAYRDFATAHPGVYPLTQVTRPGDEEIEASGARVVEPVLAVLMSFGIEGDDLIHAARAVRSTLHGFSMLEATGGFGIDVDPEDSFRWISGFLVAGLEGAA